MKYLIITPVRDEENTIEITIKSVLNQSILPAKWLIIDDNSTDNTPKIIEKYSLNYSFIKSLSIDDQRKRIPGKGPMSIFNYGIKTIELNQYDFIVKLDADMEFKNKYFETIFLEFTKDSKLGIASGLIIEKNTLKPSKKHYHEITQGPTKVYKQKCFIEIMPNEEFKGWDFLDNIKAMKNGYKTKIINNLRAIHLKPMDQSVGYQKENYLKGYYDAHLKFSILFVFVKFLKKMLLEKPLFLNGYYYFYGYCKNLFIDKEFYKDKKIISFIKVHHYRRLKEMIMFKRNLYY